MASISQTLQGAIRSVTVYLGAAGVGLAYLAQNPAGLEPLVKAEHVQAFVNVALYIVGFLVVINRFFTDESLADKAPPQA